MAKYVAAYESGRVDAVAPFYDENSMIWARKRVAVVGWPEVRAMFAGTFEKYEIDAAVHVQEVRGYGDEAFVRFLTEVRLVPKQEAEPAKPAAVKAAPKPAPKGPAPAAPAAAKATVAEPEVVAEPPSVPAPTPVTPAMRAQEKPAVQTLPPTSQPASEERRFTGNPVSLDFQGVDLRAVLRTFAEITGLNLVIDPAVNGTVDVALRDVPWDQALDIILRANQLGYTVDGNIVRIAPIKTLADEEAQRRKLADEKALSGELRVITRTLSYARASAVAQLVTKSSLSQRGTVQVDDRTNTLIISDLQPRLDAASQLLTTLDRAEPQVEIEARIVLASRNFARSIGVQWGVLGVVSGSAGPREA